MYSRVFNRAFCFLILDFRPTELLGLNYEIACLYDKLVLSDTN